MTRLYCQTISLLLTYVVAANAWDGCVWSKTVEKKVSIPELPLQDTNRREIAYLRTVVAGCTTLHEDLVALASWNPIRSCSQVLRLRLAWKEGQSGCFIARAPLSQSVKARCFRTARWEPQSRN